MPIAPKFIRRASLLVISMLLLAGCAAGGNRQILLSGGSWPGLTVYEDVIYVAYNQQVHAVNDLGQSLWIFPEQPQRGVNFFAEPAVDDEFVFVTDYSDSVYALNRETGFNVWTYSTGQDRFIGGATIGDGMVYAADVDGVLHALDRESGQEVWSFAAERESWSTPLLADGTLYFTSLDRHLYAVDAETGAMEWRYPDTDDPTPEEDIGALVSSPTLVDGVLYFGSLDSTLYALDVEDREIIWQYPLANWIFNSPVYYEEGDLLIGGDLDGNVFALDPLTGEEAWTFAADGRVVAAPVLNENEDGETIVHIVSEDTRLYTLFAETGETAAPNVTIESEFVQRLVFIETGSDMRPVPVFSTPVLFNEQIVLGMHQGTSLLQAYNQETLQPRWEYIP